MGRPRATGRWGLKRRKGRSGWHAYRNRNGRPQWVSLEAEDEPGAWQEIADLETLTHAGRKLTVGMILDEYLVDRKGRVSAYGRLEGAIIPLRRELGHLRPDQVGERHWRTYVTDRVNAKTGKAISAGTLRRERNVLVAALNLAGIKVSIRAPASPPPRTRYLTREEAGRLLGAFVSNHARLLYTILLYTGCRKGQAIELTWDRVDFTNGRIDFNDPSRMITVKRRAIVPMGPKLRAAMRKAYKVRTTDHVIEFAGKQATKVRWPFRRARERAGLGKDVTPHTLRHTAASWLAMEGVPLEQAADLLACDPSTLRRVYRKFDPGYLAGAVRALEGS